MSSGPPQRARRPRFPAALPDATDPPAVPKGLPSAGAASLMLRPQQPVRQAALDARKSHAPLGLGLDSVAVRLRMVQRLQAQGVRSPEVLRAFSQVPRHEFVDSALAVQAYEDTSLPIGHGQTISKPSVVARMLDLLCHGAAALQHRSLGRTLEIGTGCGYQAALLALLSESLVSIERIGPLYQAACQRLAPWRSRGVQLVWADGRLGHPTHAPFRSVIAAAGGDDLPPAWLEQLELGGRLIAPIHSPLHGGHVLMVVDRHETGFTRSVHEGVHFVPLKSGSE